MFYIKLQERLNAFKKNAVEAPPEGFFSKGEMVRLWNRLRRGMEKAPESVREEWKLVSKEGGNEILERGDSSGRSSRIRHGKMHE